MIKERFLEIQDNLGIDLKCLEEIEELPTSLEILSIEQIQNIQDTVESIPPELVPIWRCKRDPSGEFWGVFTEGPLLGFISPVLEEDVQVYPRFFNVITFYKAMECSETSREAKFDFPLTDQSSLSPEQLKTCAKLSNEMRQEADNMSVEAKAEYEMYYSFLVQSALYLSTPKKDSAFLIKCLKSEDMYLQETACLVVAAHQDNSCADEILKLMLNGKGNGQLAAYSTITELDHIKMRDMVAAKLKTIPKGMTRVLAMSLKKLGFDVEVEGKELQFRLPDGEWNKIS